MKLSFRCRPFAYGRGKGTICAIIQVLCGLGYLVI